MGEEPAVDNRQWLKLWLFELSCIFVSISSLLIIITVLKAFDGQPLHDLPLHITLNAFLAFFTTFTKAAFMNPVVECISQWKWNWFHQDRSLVDFDTFDKASRGVLGSILLLKLLKGRHVATLGAVISVIGIATTPITQLLIEYPSRDVPLTPSPGMPNATSRSVENYRSHIGLTGSWSLDVSYYVSSGLVHPTDSRINELEPICPSGTCAWEPFESIALCAKLSNVTHHLNVTQVPYSIPEQWTTWDDTITEDQPRLNGTLAYNVSFTANNDKYFVAPVSYTAYSVPIFQDSIAFGKDSALTRARVAGYILAWADAGNTTYTNGNSTRPDPWNWQAFEILYHVCINKYSVRVDNGTAHTEIVSSTHDITTDDEVNPPTGSIVQVNCTATKLQKDGNQLTDCAQDDRDSTLGTLTLRGSEGRNYTADIRSLTLVGKYITQDSSGIWAWDGISNMIAAGNSGVGNLADAVYGISSDDRIASDPGEKEGKSEEQLERLQNLVNNVAVSITNGLRSIGPYNSTQNSFPVVGTVFSPQVYIRVRWGWLTFLVLQLVASLVLFVCTIVSTGRLGNIPVVKSSALATLFALRKHGNGTECQAIYSGDPNAPWDGYVVSPTGVRRAARQMVAKMEGGVMILSEQGDMTDMTGTAGDTKIMSDPQDAVHTEDIDEVAATGKSEDKAGIYHTTGEITSVQE